MRRVSTALVCTGVLALALGACRREREEADKAAEGTAAELGRAADEAGKKLERGVDAAGDKASEMAREAGEAARSAGRDVKDGGQEAARDAAELGEAAADKAGEAARDVGDAAERGVHEIGMAGERAGEEIERGVGEVGAEVGAAGAERMAQASSDTADQLGTCDLSKPLYFFFKPASSDVSGDQLTRARKLGTCLKERPGTTTLTVVAYGDTNTDKRKNVEMGLKRANSIAQILIQRGSEPRQVVLQSAGEAFAAKDAQGHDTGDWARRVSVRVGN